ncbi:hypothetical protein SLEP1_g50788 [Rubroshorea leprosula]|uniref:Cytochrome P450 n=1 Tax=Rubroshorea leprosula TaxID=152421 RepID=A0AAV5M1Y3_9ROSI|nr:hypothetical protein SLEP1_g50788 [Rubroshorea leprosula]
MNLWLDWIEPCPLHPPNSSALLPLAPEQSASLSSKRINCFQLVRDEEVNRLFAAVLARSGSEMNISDLLFSLASDILCRVAFGRRFTEGSRSGRKKHHLVNLEDLRAICNEIIDEHLQKWEGRSPEKEDFVDVLLRVKEREDLEVPFADNNLKALLLDMFVTGTDTTSATLEWTMTRLARHPEAMKKAQEEVRNVASGDGKVEERNLQHFHYIKAAIKEAMRLHPSVSLLVPEESTEECMLDGCRNPGQDPGPNQHLCYWEKSGFMGCLSTTMWKLRMTSDFPGWRRGCPGCTFGLDVASGSS